MLVKDELTDKQYKQSIGYTLDGVSCATCKYLANKERELKTCTFNKERHIEVGGTGICRNFRNWQARQ